MLNRYGYITISISFGNSVVLDQVDKDSTPDPFSFIEHESQHISNSGNRFMAIRNSFTLIESVPFQFRLVS